MPKDHLINETMDEGRYRIVEPLHLGPYRKLYIAASTTTPEARFLASVVTVAKPPSTEELKEKLGYSCDGVLELGFIGHFDLRGDDELLRSVQENSWVMLERLPSGSWLRHLTAAPLGAAKAIGLGISVGEILLRAAGNGLLLNDVRPDYIWATEDRGRLVATGLTARSEQFFQHQSRHWTPFLFAQHYDSPDRKNLSVCSLTFTLATMIAEWIIGKFPFPSPGQYRLSVEQREGRPPALPVSRPLEQVLRRAFTADPAQRPTLVQFMEELKGLSAADLAT
jgi:hypothetical protein